MLFNIFFITFAEKSPVMSQTTGLEQIQSEAQLQRLTPQQLLEVRLVEMPIVDLEARVKNETEDNPALDESYGNSDAADGGNAGENEDYLDEDGNYQSETDIRLGDYGSADDIPDYLLRQMASASNEQLPIGDTVSFHDDLMGQLVDFELTDHQRVLVEYLIGSLNDNGFIEQSLSRIADEMLFDHDIETDEAELEEALAVLQQFDPAGIGARNAQESLLLQIDRKLDAEGMSESKAEKLRLERRIIADEYENFKNNNIARISNDLGMDKNVVNLLVEDMVKNLNPRPGISLCESASDRAQTAVPDFIVETDPEGNVSFTLNRGELPKLRVSQSYREMAEEYIQKGEKMNRHDKEQFAYCKDKLDKAQMFIDALAQRQQTLSATMKAIIALQHTFFISQNPEDLNNLIYKDVAERAKLDISTVSRACKTKYALVDGRLYPLSFFFKHNRKNSSGEEVDSSAVGQALKDIVEAEDKTHPFSDDQLVAELKKRGINVARRTVNKYRAELAIPSAMKRKA